MRKLSKRMLIATARMDAHIALSALARIPFAQQMSLLCCGLCISRHTPVRNALAGRRDAILCGCMHCYSSARSYWLRIHDLN